MSASTMSPFNCEENSVKYDTKSREIWIESRLEVLEKEFKNDGSDKDNAVWQEICELSKEHLFLTNPSLIGTHRE